MFAEYKDFLYKSEKKYLYDKEIILSKEYDILNCRLILIDWLLDVKNEYKLKDITFHLCINYLDRYLSKKCIGSTKLQLAGITCLFIACKYEELEVLSIEEYIYICDGIYTKKEILDMEIDILKKLDYKLTVITPLDFTFLIPVKLRNDINYRTLVNISCISYKIRYTHPSEIIKACLSIINKEKETILVKEIKKFIKNYKYSDIKKEEILCLKKIFHYE